jgi:hypothetical protein
MLDARKWSDASEGIRPWSHSGSEEWRREASVVRRLERGRISLKETAPSIAESLAKLIWFESTAA